MLCNAWEQKNIFPASMWQRQLSLLSRRIVIIERDRDRTGLSKCSWTTSSSDLDAIPIWEIECWASQGAIRSLHLDSKRRHCSIRLHTLSFGFGSLRRLLSGFFGAIFLDCMFDIYSYHEVSLKSQYEVRDRPVFIFDRRTGQILCLWFSDYLVASPGLCFQVAGALRSPPWKTSMFMWHCDSRRDGHIEMTE